MACSHFRLLTRPIWWEGGAMVGRMMHVERSPRLRNFVLCANPTACSAASSVRTSISSAQVQENVSRSATPFQIVRPVPNPLEYKLPSENKTKKDPGCLSTLYFDSLDLYGKIEVDLKEMDMGSDTSPETISMYRNLLETDQGKVKKLEIDQIAVLLRLSESVIEGRRIEDLIIRSGFKGDTFLGNLMVEMYYRCGSLKNSRRCFGHTRKKNQLSWNLITSCYTKDGWRGEATGLFNQMPDRDVVSWNIMIIAHAMAGELEDALAYFERTPERNVVSWNAMVVGYAKHGKIQEALNLFRQMPKRDVMSWNIMIAAYVQKGQLEEAHNLFTEMPEKDFFSWNLLISGYAQRGLANQALDLFEKMGQRDVVSWNVMLAGYTKSGNLSEALKLFERMQAEDMKPNETTFATILDGCAALSALDAGRDIHLQIKDCALEAHSLVANALINMYGKCGSLEEALSVFDQMKERDLGSWNAIAAAYARNGNITQATHICHKLKLDKIGPDEATLVAILHACGRAELGDECFHALLTLNYQYPIKPALEHYNLAINLLGRSRLLDETEDLVNNMPLKPNAISWKSLLGSCAAYLDIIRAKRVAGCTMKLEPETSNTYRLLAKLCGAVDVSIDEAIINDIVEACKNTLS